MSTGKKTLKEALAELEKEHGKGTVMKLASGQVFVECDVIPTGVYSIDRALGVGGIPRGRIVEIYGNEASGKTTLALQCVAQAQKKGLLAVYIDVEHAFDMEYASKLGVNVEELLFAQPASAEEAFNIAKKFAETHEVGLVVVDSVSALIPKVELEGDVGKAQIGQLARFMSQSLRQLISVFAEGNTTLLFINQIRMMVGVAFGNPETTSGGNALRYYASQRIEMKRYSSLKDKDGNAIGHNAKILIVKNKVAAPNRKTSVDLLHGQGFDRASDLFNVGSIMGIITKTGITYYVGEEKLGVGEQNAKDAFKASIDLQERVAAALDKVTTTRKEEKTDISAE